MERNDPINVRVCVTKLIPAILIVLPLLAMVIIIILKVASHHRDASYKSDILIWCLLLGSCVVHKIGFDRKV